LRRESTLHIALYALAAIAGIAPVHAQDSNGPSPVGSLDTTNASWDYLVDSSLPQDDPSSHRFRTLQAAYAAAPAGTEAKPTVIGIKPDVYLVQGTATEAGLTITKNYITLLGLTNDHRNVVLADNRGNQQGANNNGYLLIVNATGFSAVNLTILNYCNVNYEYPGDPRKNLKARSDVITQAVALQAQGDKHKYDHVALLSKLDTTFIQTQRAYFKNVYIEGTDDFIGGGTISVWDHCVIFFPTGSGVTTVSGTVFLNSTFLNPIGTMQIYKSPARPATLINCTLPVNKERSVAWVRGTAPARPNLYSLTYRNKDAGGNSAAIADGSKGPLTYSISRELSDQEVVAFNPWNLLRATPTGAADDWDPAGVREQYESRGQGSLVYRMAMTGGSPSIITGRAGATIGATVSPARAEQTIKWSTTSNLVSLSNTEGPSVVVSGRNTTDKAQYVPVKATASNGFYVTAWVYVQPAYIDPPTLRAGIKLGAPAGGTVTAAYQLNTPPVRPDQSIISWYSCDDASCANARPVAVSRGDKPLGTYALVPGDIGRYLEASIQPKVDISDPGAAATGVSARPIAKADLPSSTVSPNFANFVVTPNSAYVSGYWTVAGTWTSSIGNDFVNGFGVRSGSVGAALLYQQDAPTGDMQVEAVMSPEKTEGQGFGMPGSALDGNSQNADIYIKYDPRTKTGYSLRWWRTTQSASKCMFQLYRHVNGVGTPLSPTQVLTGVFKSNTYVTLTVSGSVFTVKAHNTVDSETLTLDGSIDPNTFGGAGVRWSGSVPQGNGNVYSFFKISYPGSGGLSPRQ
jgi:hypothetical protein